MNNTTSDFVRAGTLEELKAKGRLVVHGHHRPVLLVHESEQVFALDNRCPHMGFPLDRGSVEDGILTCHWHHARLELASGCTFDLWADDLPTCPVEIRAGGEISLVISCVECRLVVIKVYGRAFFGHRTAVTCAGRRDRRKRK